MRVNYDPRVRNFEFLKLCTTCVILMMFLGYITWAAIFDKTFMGFITDYIKLNEAKMFVLFIQMPFTRFFIALCSFIGFWYPFCDFVRLILAWMRGQEVFNTFFAQRDVNFEMSRAYAESERKSELRSLENEAYDLALIGIYGDKTPEYYAAKERDREKERLDYLEREMRNLRTENEQLKNRKLTYAETMPTYNERERIRNEARIFADEVNRMNRKSLFK